MYYSRFVPDHAQLLGPLHELTRKDAQWKWGPMEQKAFNDAKHAITKDSVLMHFDAQLPITLACDASPTGIACCISHVINGVERPVMFIARRLFTAEKLQPIAEERSQHNIWSHTTAPVFIRAELYNYYG